MSITPSKSILPSTSLLDKQTLNNSIILFDALFDEASQSSEMLTTALPNVHLFKSTENLDKRSLHYEKCLIFVLSGNKTLYFNGDAHRYCASNYVVLTTPMPLQFSQIASDTYPVRMIGVSFDVAKVSELTQTMKAVQPQKFDMSSPQGLFINTMTTPLEQTLHRLLYVLQHPVQTEVLGEAVVRELLFWVMMQEGSHALFALVQSNTHLAKVGQVIQHMSMNYAQSLSMQDLAGLVNVSVPTLHRIFKDVTTTSPMQYLKVMRLHKARDLLMQHRLPVSQVARQVGYDSSTQFSREFKRLFSVSPSEYLKS